MIDMKRKCDYILRLLAMALVSAALAAWPGPFMPEAVRSLAPENTVLHGLETDSVALAGRRGGGGRSGSAPRGSGGGYSGSYSGRRSGQSPCVIVLGAVLYSCG